MDQIAQSYWLEIPNHFPNIQLDEYIIMPNYVHGIIYIDKADMVVGAKNFSPLRQNNTLFQSPSKTIGSMIRGFKIGVTKFMRKNTDIYHVWQRNYWEHIIRNKADLNRIRKYTYLPAGVGIENPLKWNDDRYYPI